MEDDRNPSRTSDKPATSGARDDLSPDEELQVDINNLSIEDSPAGPGVRINNPEVSTIPDTPLVHHALAYDKALDVQLDETTIASTSSSDSDVNIESYCSSESLSDIDTVAETQLSEIIPPTNQLAWDNPSPSVPPNVETPFSSATDIVTDKNTGAISKSTTSNNPNTHHIIDPPSGCVSITKFFKKAPRQGTNKAPPPNICTWNNDKDISKGEERVRNPSYRTPNTFNEPLPQRPSLKRARRDTHSGENPPVSAAAPLIIDPIGSSQNNITNAVPTETRNDPNRATDRPCNTTNAGNNANNTDKSVTFSLQDRENNGEFLPIPNEGLPFFRRARGCFSAEVRAQTRASHLDRLSDNGKPPRWSYGIGPLPSYIKPLASELVNIKRRHALEFSRAVARSLRDSALTSNRQGKLNLDTVETIYADDSNGFERASTKLTSLVSRDNTQENERLDRREELIARSPTTDQDIIDHLSGRKVASRSYAGVTANDPPQPNDNNNQDNANPGNRRNRSGSRQRSRSRSRGGNANRGNNGNRRNNSRSPIRNRDNQRNGDRTNRPNERRAANSGRGQRNGPRGQSRNNNYRERDSAYDFMEKMFTFFQNR